MALEPGSPAPDFSLPSTSGRDVSLGSLRGQKVVLYFYPRDDTPGCTREACAFRDNLARVTGAGAVVLGVSKDSPASHAKFRGKYELPFHLLTDADNDVARRYQAFGKKTLYGRSFEGTIRTTYLLDEKGRVAAAWSPVKVDGHADAVLAALRGERAPSAPPKAAKKPLAKKPAAKK